MGDVGSWVKKAAQDAVTIGTTGIVDARNGRVNVPFSGSQGRAALKAILNTGSQHQLEPAIGEAIDHPVSRKIATAGGALAGTIVGAGAGASALNSLGVAGGTLGGGAAGGAGAAAPAAAGAAPAAASAGLLTPTNIALAGLGTTAASQAASLLTKPKIPGAPPPLEAPTVDTAAELAQQNAEQKRRAKAVVSTALTGPTGILGTPPVQRSVLSAFGRG